MSRSNAAAVYAVAVLTGFSLVVYAYYRKQKRSRGEREELKRKLEQAEKTVKDLEERLFQTALLSEEEKSKGELDGAKKTKEVRIWMVRGNIYIYYIYMLRTESELINPTLVSNC